MKSKISIQIQSVSGFPPKVTKKQPNALTLPTPATVRHRAVLDEWRERLWRSRYKFLTLLGPQHRELIRKMIFSMGKARLPEMVSSLLLAVFGTWFFTGSISKMEEFIVAVFNGRVFLLNSRRLFLPPNTPKDLTNIELIHRLLLYNPHSYPEDWTLQEPSQVTRFLDWLGTPPADKPWIQEWVSEMRKTRRQAAMELGKVAAESLWAEVTGVKKRGNADSKSDINQKTIQRTKKVSYW